MKLARFLCAVLLICTFTGCSNSSADGITPILNSFKCDFTIQDSDLGGEMIIEENGDLAIIFAGPDIINGTCIRVVGETVIIEVQGITERYPRETVPDGSPALYIYDALISASGKELKARADKTMLEGNCKSGDFTAVINGTGFINELDLEKSGTVISFSNCIKLN